MGTSAQMGQTVSVKVTFSLNDTDKKKSSGVLYPVAQLIINKPGSFSLSSAETPGTG
jgi:hypothetical protein